jgi:hypothetical protein
MALTRQRAMRGGIDGIHGTGGNVASVTDRFWSSWKSSNRRAPRRAERSRVWFGRLRGRPVRFDSDVDLLVEM